MIFVKNYKYVLRGGYKYLSFLNRLNITYIQVVGNLLYNRAWNNSNSPSNAHMLHFRWILNYGAIISELPTIVARI